MSPFALVVGGAVVDDLRRPTTLLAARRTEPPHLAGGWELPGGKVDPGEDPMTALHRELAEELGVRVEVGAELPGPDAELPGWPLPPAHRMRVWLVRVVEGEPAPIEAHDELRDLPAGRWLDVAWLPADVPIVRALVALAGHGALPDGQVVALPDGQVVALPDGEVTLPDGEVTLPDGEVTLPGGRPLAEEGLAGST